MNNRTTLFALSLLALVGTASFLGACATTAGAGEDLSRTGKAIERTAKQNTPQ